MTLNTVYVPISSGRKMWRVSRENRNAKLPEIVRETWPAYDRLSPLPPHVGLSCF